MALLFSNTRLSRWPNNVSPLPLDGDKYSAIFSNFTTSYWTPRENYSAHASFIFIVLTGNDT